VSGTPISHSAEYLCLKATDVARRRLVVLAPHLCWCLNFFSRSSPPPMRIGLVLLAFLAIAPGTGALLSAQTKPGPGSGSDTAAVVRAGDVIRLKIWREPEMSGEVAVDEAGVATLPRLGALKVADLPADSLKRMLLRSYAKYLRDPAVEIIVLRRITVLGAVKTPNVYHIEPTMTVSDALALAGGAAPDGKVDEVELRRGSKYAIVKLSRGTRLADTPMRSGDELYVPQRSWLSRNAGLVLAGIGTAVSVMYFAFR
jgi:protein involved in polysaccharide export with SLBB domain